MVFLRPLATKLLTVGLLVGSAYAQSPDPNADRAAPPVRGAPVSPTPAEPGSSSTPSVEEMIRVADGLLDRMESMVDGDDTTVLQGRFTRSLDAIKSAAPDNPWVFYISGRKEMLAGREGDAVTQLRRFVDSREGRNEWRAHRLLGDLFVDEFPQLARASYDRAAALNAGDPSVLFGLSKCAAKSGRLDEAVDGARKAVAAQPTTQHLAHLARLLMSQKRWADADLEGKRALQMAKEAASGPSADRNAIRDLDAQYKLVIDFLQSRLNSPEPAAQDYLDLAKLIKERSENATRLGLFEALRVLEAGVKKSAPQTPSALLEQYALTLAAVGRTGAAAVEFEKLQKIDPTFTKE